MTQTNTTSEDLIMFDEQIKKCLKRQHYYTAENYVRNVIDARKILEEETESFLCSCSEGY